MSRLDTALWLSAKIASSDMESPAVQLEIVNLLKEIKDLLKEKNDQLEEHIRLTDNLPEPSPSALEEMMVGKS